MHQASTRRLVAWFGIGCFFYDCVDLMPRLGDARRLLPHYFIVGFMTDAEEMNRLREQIAQTVSHRDALKAAIANGDVPARKGLRDLIEVDARLSELDSRFKQFWDAANPRKTRG